MTELWSELPQCLWTLFCFGLLDRRLCPANKCSWLCAVILYETLLTAWCTGSMEFTFHNHTIVWREWQLCISWVLWTAACLSVLAFIFWSIYLIYTLQIQSVIRTIKIWKTFLKFKMQVFFSISLHSNDWYSFASLLKTNFFTTERCQIITNKRKPTYVHMLSRMEEVTPSHIQRICYNHWYLIGTSVLGWKKNKSISVFNYLVQFCTEYFADRLFLLTSVIAFDNTLI